MTWADKKKSFLMDLPVLQSLGSWAGIQPWLMDLAPPLPQKSMNVMWIQMSSAFSGMKYRECQQNTVPYSVSVGPGDAAQTPGQEVWSWSPAVC